MPTIEVTTSTKLSLEQRVAIKTELGKAIELIPGKTEQWLMVLFKDQTEIYFHGEQNSDSAYVSVGIRGKASREDFGRLGERITEILTAQTKLSADRIYVSYSEFENFSWSGSLL
jgi:hypothetical protein